MKTVLGIVVMTAAVTGLYFANDLARDEHGKSVLHVAGELPIIVRAAEPESRDIIRTVQAPGEVEPLFEVDISAEVVGKILEMPVEEGDSVRRGDLLCRLDDVDYKARLVSAKANVVPTGKQSRPARTRARTRTLRYELYSSVIPSPSTPFHIMP